MGEQFRSLPKVRQAKPHLGGPPPLTPWGKEGCLSPGPQTTHLLAVVHAVSPQCPPSGHCSKVPSSPIRRPKPKGLCGSTGHTSRSQDPQPGSPPVHLLQLFPTPPPCSFRWVEGQPQEQPAQKPRKVKRHLIPPRGPLIAIPDTNCN